MGTANGKIYAPVSIADVNACLKTNNMSLDKLCTAKDAINKWSKFKPVAHTIKFGSGSKSALTEAQAKGADMQIIEGIVYGLKVGTDDFHWQDLHGCTYDYVGIPDGVNFPYRLMDFDGYDDNASPTLYGSLVNNVINPSAVNLRVGIAWNDKNNTTGVDILKMVAGDANINGYYVGVLVDKYAITCINVRTGTRTPIVYNGAKQDTFYINSLPQGYGNGSSATCTFFLSPLLLEEWTDVSRQTQQGEAIALPDAAGLPISITSASSVYGKFTIDSIGQDNGGYITASVTCTEVPAEAGYYRLRVVIGSNATQAEVRVATAGGVIFPRMTNPVLIGGTYNYSATLSRLDKQGGNPVATLATATGSITITV